MRLGVKWILNTKRFRIGFSILGLPPTLERLYTLSLKFKRHIKEIDEDNPLNVAFYINNYKSRIPRNSFFYKVMDWDHLFHLKYFGLKDPVIPDDEDPNDPDIDLIGLDSRIKDLIYKSNFGSSALTSCILPFARVKKKTDKNYIKETNSSDQCIYINDPITRYRAIRWRLNTFLYKKICPICHREMNRAHIQKCKLFMHVPFWHFICNDDIYAYKSELRKYGDHPPPNYNILDIN
ncbi:hypothetical protein LY90DRAFT_519494 [Neocallimastix californiae]|nr:hypothetical protein LY90DRAFT_519494 [Neocallimastix californiae]|eukprot:ORY03908.1 hypothetical protein LY90DRAFT_519494 [Neocallimastix californiae]